MLQITQTASHKYVTTKTMQLNSWWAAVLF